MPSKRLLRQIKKAFGVEDAIASLAEKDQELSAKLNSLVELVDEMYAQQDEKIYFAQHNLEISSLELLEANNRLSELNQTFDALVNSLGQGFLIFGPDRRCLPVFSKACETLLETNPAGKPLEMVLKCNPAESETLAKWCEILFQDRLMFDSAAELGPAHFRHSQGQVIALEYKPCRDSDGNLIYVVMMATNKTAEVQARHQAQELEQFVGMIVAIIKNRDQFRYFVSDTRKILSDLSAVAQREPFSEREVVLAKALLHTLKGAASTFAFAKIQMQCHSHESALEELYDIKAIQAYLRENSRALRTEFEALLRDNQDIVGKFLAGKDLREVETELLLKFAKQLHEGGVPESLKKQFIDNFLAVPVRCVFTAFEKRVEEMSKRLGKRMNPFCYSGDDFKVIYENYSELFNSLVHIFNNIVDHGIESPESRRAAGKAAAGNIKIAVSRRERFLDIEIADDGAGIDMAKIRRKLEELGQTDRAKKARDKELLDVIFEPSFSTSTQVTTFSGRGMGLAAVKAEVLKLGGQIRVTSNAGTGTAFKMELPLITETQVIKKSAS